MSQHLGIFRLSCLKVISFGAVLSFLSSCGSAHETLPSISEISSKGELPSVTSIWFPEVGKHACFARSEIGSRPPAPAPKPVIKKIVRHKRKNRNAIAALEKRVNLWIEELEKLNSDILNYEDPVQKIALEKLSEVESAEAVLHATNSGEVVPQEEVGAYVEGVGRFRKTDFSAISASLKEAKKSRSLFDDKKSKGILAYNPARPTKPPPSLSKSDSVHGTTIFVATQPKPKAPDPGGITYGNLHIAPSVYEWLEEQKGHIELYLQPEKSKNPQDAVFLTDYEFPSDRFEVNTRGRVGAHRVVARVFIGKDPHPVAQITHPETISAETHRKNLYFNITDEQVKKGSRKAAPLPSEGLVLNVTVFEALSGDKLHPAVVKNPQVTLLGLGEHAVYQGDKEGNVRIPKIPFHSEILVKVEALGFHPSVQAVPTFDTDVYHSTSLLPRDKVENITRYFLKSPQTKDRGFVFGSLTDSKKRQPIKGATVEISGKKTGALYFGILPDPGLSQTTDNGLFGFFNVGPSFRSIRRSDGMASPLVQVVPDHASFLELGRGGVASFYGRLVDPFEGNMPEAKINLVGSQGESVTTADDGSFEIPKIDHPPSVITLEIKAKEFPTTWHTIPWNTHYANRRRRLYMMADAWIKDGVSSVAKVSMNPESATIVGGGEAALFKQTKGCLSVVLLDGAMKPVSEEKGPFPLSWDNTDKGPLCLTKEKAGFSFFNLEPGQYFLKWVNSQGLTVRSHVVRAGRGRVSIAVN